MTSDQQPTQQLFFTLIQLLSRGLHLSCFSECTARSQFPHSAEKQAVFSEAVISSPAPQKPEQLCNSGAEIKLQSCSTWDLNLVRTLFSKCKNIQVLNFVTKKLLLSSSESKAICFSSGENEYICLVNIVFIIIFHSSAFYRKSF